MINKTSDIDKFIFKNLDKAYKVVLKDDFRFANCFIQAITHDYFKTARFLLTKRVPTAHVVGRKKDASKLRKDLLNHGIRAEVADYQTKEEIKGLLMDGCQVILYLNSRVSKGIDLPFINAVMIYSFKFAVPDEKDPIKAMRDELEQVIMRCSPTDELDFIPRMIIWRKVKKRNSSMEKDFVKNWLNSINVPQNYDVKDVLKSTFLPLSNLDQLPIKISSNDLKKDKLPQLTTVATKTINTSWKRIRSNKQNKNPNLIKYKQTHVLKVPNSTYLVYYTPLKHAINQNRAGQFFNIKPENLVSLWGKVKGKILTREEVYNVFKKAGIQRKGLMSLVINLLILSGSLKKEKVERKVLYVFGSNEPEEPRIPDEVKIKHMVIVEKQDNFGNVFKDAEEEGTA